MVFYPWLRTPPQPARRLGLAAAPLHWLALGESGEAAVRAMASEARRLQGREGLALVVRAAGTPTQDFAITQITMHPHYHPFEDAWRSYGPLAAGAGGLLLSGCNRINANPGVRSLLQSAEGLTMRAQRIIADPERLLQALSKKFVLRFFRFSNAVDRLKGPAELQYGGSATRLGLTYYFYPSGSTALSVGFISSPKLADWLWLSVVTTFQAARPRVR